MSAEEETGHTPTWRTGPQGRAGVPLYAGDLLIAYFTPEKAETIVRAVNSFEPMRRALEWIAKEAGEFGDGAPDAHHAQKVLLNLEAKAKAALASVRKE